jgi:hypothetical protein
MTDATEKRAGSKAPPPPTLRIRNFAHLADVNLALGDLTVLVGPQGAGKSLALQWLKVALDGRELVDALRDAGHATERSSVLVDLIFGSGMASAWRAGDTHVEFDGVEIEPETIPGRGSRAGRLFFVPAHRSMLISDGWKLTAETPAVARLFSQELYERFRGEPDGVHFPVEGRLKKEIRDAVDAAVFHGGVVGMQEDAMHTRRLRLSYGSSHLPFMTWTAGQREFTPLLLGLYHLLPSGKVKKRADVDWVVIEELEMGLHPQAITAALLLVLELLSRGYRVVMSSHSPHVLTMMWMMRILKAHSANPKLLCDAFGVNASDQMKRLAKTALTKDYRVYSLEFEPDGKVHSQDISTLDPFDEDERVSGWGGLTTYSSHFSDAVRDAVNESDDAPLEVE